jgi:hypothetical protein
MSGTALVTADTPRLPSAKAAWSWLVSLDDPRDWLSRTVKDNFQ